MKKRVPGPENRAGHVRRKGKLTWLKWVGAVSAVLSLIFGLQQLASLISAAQERRHHLAELLNIAKLQRSGGNFDAAWTSLEEAALVAKSNPLVSVAREDLAMDWLENIRVVEGRQTFTDIVNKIVPVLDRGVTLAKGSRKADLLAHLGWADFLREREGLGGLEPEKYYRQALNVDSRDAYAHAMWGPNFVEETRFASG